MLCRIGDGKLAKRDKELTREQKLDLLKGLGRGIVELAKSSKPAGYMLSSLVLLGLGKTKILSCAAVGTLQGVNTYIAISDVVEEAGDAGFFGIGGMGETIAKGGTSVLIGALWGRECQVGRTRYSDLDKQPEWEEKGYVEKVQDIRYQVWGGK